MQSGVSEEVHDRALEQPGVGRGDPGSIGCDGHRRAFGLGGGGTDRDNIDGLELSGGGHPAAQAAGQEDVFNQVVEPSDLFGGFFGEGGALFLRVCVLEEGDLELQSRQRGSQLMGGVCEHPALLVDQRGDAVGGVIEALGQPGHLIVSFDGDSALQISFPECRRKISRVPPAITAWKMP